MPSNYIRVKSGNPENRPTYPACFGCGDECEWTNKVFAIWPNEDMTYERICLDCAPKYEDYIQ